MITIAVVGILAGVAFPSYLSYIQRGNRSAAQQFMTDVASREQQLMLDMRQYVAVASTANFPNAPTATASGLNLSVPSTTSGKYTFVVAADNNANPPTFTITATATGSQLSDGNLTLDQAGTKAPSTKW